MKLSLIAAALLASTVALCESGTKKMVIGYFPNWLYANYPVENIPFTKYTHINYAFAILNNENNLPSFSDDWAIESSLPKVVKLAHENQTKVLLSVGGWTGSKRFSPMVASPLSRKQFIDWNLEFIEKYNTDGVDLDWEYPGKQAAGCNEFDVAHDADNFLLLLKELRAALDQKWPQEHKEISMAVHVQPFLKNEQPLMDLKEFVPYFDHVNLMTYDINGAWADKTGPNAPFRFEQGKGAPFSFVNSIQDWKKAGVPSSKITAGLAFYGRSMKVSPLESVPSYNNGEQRSQFLDSVVGAPKGDSDDAYWDDPYCNKDTGGLSGIWKWTNLRKEGLLKDDFVTPGEGWQRHWDQVSQTPWLFNPTTKNFISYDDPQSLNIKVEHALCEDLAGVMVWDIHQDNGELLEVVNRIHNPIMPESCATSRLEENNAAAVAGILPPPAAHSSSTSPLPISDANNQDYDDDEKELTPVPEYPPYSIDPIKNEIPTPSVSVISAPPTPAASLWGSNVEWQACSNNGEEKCVESGSSGQWLTCNFNSWIVRQCIPGLVCQNAAGGNGIYCDFPAVKEASANVVAEQAAVAAPIVSEAAAPAEPSAASAPSEQTEKVQVPMEAQVEPMIAEQVVSAAPIVEQQQEAAPAAAAVEQEKPAIQ